MRGPAHFSMSIALVKYFRERMTWWPCQQRRDNSSSDMCLPPCASFTGGNAGLQDASSCTAGQVNLSGWGSYIPDNGRLEAKTDMQTNIKQRLEPRKSSLALP
jgi:hypothetical protein